MQNEYDLQNVENFKINPHVWLQTLLAIAGDKERRREAIQAMADENNIPFEQASIIFAKTIKVLMNDTRSN